MIIMGYIEDRSSNPMNMENLGGILNIYGIFRVFVENEWKLQIQIPWSHGCAPVNGDPTALGFGQFQVDQTSQISKMLMLQYISIPSASLIIHDNPKDSKAYMIHAATMMFVAC